MKSLSFTVKENSIGWLEWDSPHSSVNLLSLSFLKELESVLKQIKQKPLKALVLISKKASGFSAGVNIKEIQKIQTKREIKQILDQAHHLFLDLENLKIPKVAVIHGLCLGGGLELALCFNYRLLADSPDTRLALPEVHLGLIPGFGACQRLPQLIGIKQSLDMILSGKSLNPAQALKAGLADEKIPSLILEKTALDFTNSISLKSGPDKTKHKKHSFIEKAFPFALYFLAKKQILKKTKGFYPAPLKALEVIKKTSRSPLSLKSLEIEKAAFCHLFQTPESKNLIQVFKMRDQAKKISPQQSFSPEIKKVAVLGAGVMGRDIAWLFANKGFKTRLIDNKEQSLCSALNRAEELWEKKDPFKQKNLSVSLNFWGFSTFDLVIEALPENEAIKTKLIKEISKKLNKNCLFASNSSSLDLLKLAQSHSLPDHFFGLHFFNPAHKMPLVEIALRESQTNFPLNSVKRVLKRLGKIPLVVKSRPGLIVNRLLAVYLTEALFLLEEGFEPPFIDHCYRDQFGLPLGPFQLMDKIGLDISQETLAHLSKAGLNIKSPSWARELPSLLGLGEKSGQGFYIYGSKKTTINKKINKLKKNSFPQALPPKTIIERGVYKMINEGAKLLKDQIVKSPEDIDLALILGIGWPPFLGGPMSYAQNIGWPKIKETLEHFSNQHGSRFKPHF